MAGFSNEVVYAKNVNFTQAAGYAGVQPTVVSNGQLLIGSTASPNIRVGTLSSSNGSLTITNGAGTIDLTVASGTGTIMTLTGNSGGALSPTAGNINVIGAGSITVAGGASTLTAQLTGLTNHSVLVGAGTTTITSLTVGTTGQLLVGATGADPAFGSSANADFTFGGANSGATRTFSVTNTSNTASSATNVQVTVGGGTASDPQTTYTVTGATNWSQGIDNSVSDTYVISASTALGTTDVMRMTTAGSVTKPLQPAFLAFAPTAANITGAALAYQYGTSAMTVVYDQGGNFNTNGTFTAPVTGRYNFISAGYLEGCTVGIGARMVIITSNRSYESGGFRTASNQDVTAIVSALADMDAADTATTTITGFGEAGNTEDLLGGNGTYFCGSLIC